MPKRSAGILMYRGGGDALELLLVHPGGPFWANKDLGAWSIPKGEYEAGEDPLAVAKREFQEELGVSPPQRSSSPEGDSAQRVVYRELGEIVQPSRKIVTAWAVEGEFDPAALKSNSFEMEWPPKSGRMQSFPEVDRAAWFALDEARAKILPGQAGFIDRLLTVIRASPERC
jgi:predicted NUDIX family NTP pyrophosphohydrolase